MSRPIYSIRFPLVIERTKVGRRVRKRLVADKSALHGARLCAAGMVTIAISHRTESQEPDPSWCTPERAALRRRVARLHMRQSALWARVFAGHIDQHDPRIDSAGAEASALVRTLCAEVAA